MKKEVTKKKKRKVRPIKSTAEKQNVEEKIEEKGLRLVWIKFIDAYIANGGNGQEAYKVAYPDVTDDTARANASRLLANANVRDEIDNKLEAQKITEDLIGKMLLEKAGYSDSFRINASVKALEVLAKMKGLLVDTKKIAFTGDNPAVFASPYSAERKAELDKMHAGDGKVPVRIIE